MADGLSPPAALAARLAPLHAALDGERLAYFPVRHHSPACAWHLDRLIAARRPAAVLVEGPAPCTALLPLLLHPETVPPIACYTTFTDRRPLPVPPGLAPVLAGQPARHAAFYPFTDCSPEYVALRAGQAVGARLAFIDLPFAQQVLAQRVGEAPTVRQVSLQAEAHLAHSRYLAELARRTGCRDRHDLWDHLFEVAGPALPTAEFVRRVATYCFMAREDHDPALLAADGTAAREAAMAAAIATALAETSGLVLVVTGGFHTVALPALVAAQTAAPPPAPVAAEDTHTVLMRYSEPHLDQLNGYASGMPAPHYYDRLWHHLLAGTDNPWQATATELLVALGRLARAEERPFFVSPADELAAARHATDLARLRGHPGPSREDLLDAVRSCLVKGAMDGEGEVVMALARQLCAGERVGQVPAAAGQPPLVADAYRQLAAFDLEPTQLRPREFDLELYRQARHRRLSRLFHQLGELQVSLARCTGGPDFVRGTGLELLREHWSYQWSPTAETALITASVYGTTVAEAATAHLLERVAELATAGQAQRAEVAVSFLVQALRMGLHAQVEVLVALIRRHLAEDARFTGQVAALRQLLLLRQAREPLGAHELTALPELLAEAGHRAAALLPGLVQLPDDDVLAAVAALGDLVDLLGLAPELPADLAVAGLRQLADARPGQAAVVGAAAGLLHRLGHLPEEALRKRLAGMLASPAGAARHLTAYLFGLLQGCREIAWRSPWFIATMDELLGGWDDADFLHRLPELRLAFADLTPRETDRVAGAVAARHGQASLGPLAVTTVTAEAAARGAALEEVVQAAIAADRLADWLTVEAAP